MRNRKTELMMRILLTIVIFCSLITTTLLSSCSEDPKPVNEDELITTLIVDLTPTGGDPIQLKFYDEDGPGAIEPVITPTLAQLAAGQTYMAVLTLRNESEIPAEDITSEIEQEKNDHLFCFAVTGTNVTINYDDEDDNNHPIGLSTTWTAGDAGSEGMIKITLRHQPGLKDGTCPGSGDTDIEVTFNVQIVN